MELSPAFEKSNAHLQHHPIALRPIQPLKTGGPAQSRCRHHAIALQAHSIASEQRPRYEDLSELPLAEALLLLTAPLRPYGHGRPPLRTHHVNWEDEGRTKVLAM
jgi:hypothetical protein